MRQTFPIQSRRALLVCSAMMVLGLLACDHERKAPRPYEERLDARAVVWEPPQEVPALGDVNVKTRVLDLSEPRRFPECWELFELDGKVRENFPLPERAERAMALASCDVEASLRLDDGGRVYAWGSAEKPGTRARDLRIGAWGTDGKLRWSLTLDRSRQAPNWIANFRRSFLVDLTPRHVCFGTLWEGETQAGCVDAKTGEDNWRGSLPFWSGILPQAGADGFVVADISSISKRYPFSGAEMRHLQLEGLGGRAGYYATDGQRLYYTGSREEQPRLIAYDFDKFEPVWQTPLPGMPTSSVATAFDDLDLGLIKIEEVLYGFDTESGAVRWALNIGLDIPSFAAHGKMLYVLYRQPDAPNMLFAVDPKSGAIQWKSPTPAGTLRVESVDGILVLGSIRAVQHVRGLDLPENSGG